MKIILGICGFGLGHSTRQRPILEGLLARGHDVILIANDSSYQFYTEQYPQVRLARVYVPVMHTTTRGLDFAATAADPRNARPDITRSFWEACGLIEREYGCPDLVISDYDMVSAQIAYLFGVRLVTLDQQSKFLGYDFPDTGGYSPNEHRMRLSYFFPKATARIATSFFQVNYRPRPDYPVTIIPPIIGLDLKDQIAEPIARQITVYLSAASQVQQTLGELVAIFARFPDHMFFCFVEGQMTQLPANVILMSNSRSAFLSCLRQSSAVISTAGHNLITEALYLHVPMFLLPFNHYEQQLNAHIIAQERLGYADSIVDESNLQRFFDHLESYQNQESALIYRKYDGDTVFLDFIQTLQVVEGK